MPWREATAMSLRLEFVQLAMKDGANISQLCRDFGISRKTGYKWLQRFVEGGGTASSLRLPGFHVSGADHNPRGARAISRHKPRTPECRPSVRQFRSLSRHPFQRVSPLTRASRAAWSFDAGSG